MSNQGSVWPAGSRQTIGGDSVPGEVYCMTHDS